MAKNSNIYIPIEYSKLSEIIPEDDEILYSTLCSAKWERRGETKFWQTHVLITRTGLAYSKTEDNGQIKRKFYLWSKMPDTPFTKLKKQRIYFNNTWFTVIRDEKYESEEIFNSRSKKFGDFCKEFFKVSREEHFKRKVIYILRLDHRVELKKFLLIYIAIKIVYLIISFSLSLLLGAFVILLNIFFFMFLTN